MVIGFILILLSVAYLTNQFPQIDLLFKIFFGAILFPLLLFSFITLLGMINFYNKQKKLKILNELKFEVHDSSINKNSKWFFTGFAKKIMVNDYEIICFIDDLSSDLIQFQLKINIENYSKKQKLLHHQEVLKRENIYASPYFESVTKTFSSKAFKQFNVVKVESELLSFVTKMETQYL